MTTNGASITVMISMSKNCRMSFEYLQLKMTLHNLTFQITTIWRKKKRMMKEITKIKHKNGWTVHKIRWMKK
jgi:hypothetical protein